MRDLFEDLKEKVGCDYISDLKYGTNPSFAARRVSRLQQDEYDLPQWNDLADYLFSEKKQFTSALEAVSYFEGKCV